MATKATNEVREMLMKPRLVKKEEVEARVVAIEEARRERAKNVEAPVALLRAPRNANEARNMFDSLFKAA